MLATILLFAIWAGLLAALYIGLKARLKPWEPRWYPAAVVVAVVAVMGGLAVAAHFLRPPGDDGCPSDEWECAPAHPWDN